MLFLPIPLSSHKQPHLHASSYPNPSAKILYAPRPGPGHQTFGLAGFGLFPVCIPALRHRDWQGGRK